MEQTILNNEVQISIRMMDSLRQILHRYVYNDPEVINKFILYLNGDSELFIPTFNPTTMTYNLRIKKMNIKKMPNFANDIMFYYSIFNKAMINLLNDPYVFNYNINGKLLKEYEEYNYMINNPNVVSMLYNANIISDISIILYI